MHINVHGQISTVQAKKLVYTITCKKCVSKIA